MIITKLLIFTIFSIVSAELVQVAILFRHGARYHLNSQYDGGQTKSKWGQLTSVGMRQHYNLGQTLRKQYIENLKFLRPNYNHTEIQVYSTIVKRVIDSATSHLYGFYPIGTGPQIPSTVTEDLLVPPFKYNDDNGDKFAVPFGHQIIPIFTGGLMLQCGNQDLQQRKNIADQHATVEEMNMRYKPFLANIAKIFNLSAPIDIVNMSALYDTLTVDKFLNRQWPKEFTQEDYQNFQHLQYFTYLLKLNKNLGRATTTNKFSKIISNFDNRISSPGAKLKWTILSAHDTEVYPTLNILNITSSTCIEELYRFNRTNALNCREGVQFAASVLFELHRNEVQRDNYYVMVKYNGKYVNLCERQSKQCQYNEWKQRVLKYAIDFKTICGDSPISPEKLIEVSQ